MEKKEKNIDNLTIVWNKSITFASVFLLSNFQYHPHAETSRRIHRRAKHHPACDDSQDLRGAPLAAEAPHHRHWLLSSRNVPLSRACKRRGTVHTHLLPERVRMVYGQWSALRRESRAMVRHTGWHATCLCVRQQQSMDDILGAFYWRRRSCLRRRLPDAQGDKRLSLITHRRQECAV